MLEGTTMFIDSLNRWVSAISRDAIDKAHSIADAMETDAQRMILHPDFHKCVEMHFDGMEPHQVLHAFSQVLKCATQVRARALGDRGTAQPE